MTQAPLQSTGFRFLDDALGGGLQPGTLALICGATGIGKTQFGLGFLNAGLAADGRRGVVLDMSTRGDSQQHAEYAHRLFGWNLVSGDIAPDEIWGEKNLSRDPGTAAPAVGEHGRDARASRESRDSRTDTRQIDRCAALGYTGDRVVADAASDEWHNWQAELNRRLGDVARFLYTAFLGGARRVLIDGVEPFADPARSVQMSLFEYVLHQVIRSDAEWLARDVLRHEFHRRQAEVRRHVYSPADIGTVFLQTTHETMLDDLIDRPLAEGDLAANASTIILMGRRRTRGRLSRALLVLKHRGRKCSEEIIPFDIGERGPTA